MEFILQLMITDRCNLRCTHCYGNFGELKRKELSISEWKNIILDTKNLCDDIGFNLTIHFSGGEPLAYRGIYGLIEFCKEKAIKTVLLSNGVLINKNTALRLSDVGLDYCQISLESYKKEVHDNIRGKTTFEKIIDAINNIKDNTNIQIATGMAVMRDNFSEYEEFAEFSIKKLDVDRVVYHRFVPMGRGNRTQLITAEEHDSFLDAIKKLKIKYGDEKIIYTDPLLLCKLIDLKDVTEDEMGGCSAGFSVLSIASDGEVYPCPRLPISCGNANEIDVGAIYWNSEVMRTIRDREKLKGKCGGCKIKNQCGGCRAYAYGLTQDIMGEDSLCVYNVDNITQKTL